MTPSRLLGLALVGVVAGVIVGGGSICPSPLLVQGAVWLFLTASLLFLCPLALLRIYRRRHIADIRLRDASSEPAPMRPFEQAWDAELRQLGFRCLGVLELTGPLDRPEKWWAYADSDGRICADISERRRYVNFSTTFEDGATLLIRNAAVLPTANLPLYLALNVPGPGGSVSPAYQALLANLQPFAAAHGEAIRRRNMVEVLAAEERSLQTAPGLPRTRGRADRLAEALLLLVVFAGWLIQSRQVLDLL
jgi:hypothetical protein